MSASCELCDKSFSSPSNMNKHKRQVHHIQPSILTYDGSVWSHKCLENNCNRSFRKNIDLVQHLEDVHELHVDIRQLEFTTFEKFLRWKMEMETKEKCNYVLARGKTNKVSGEEITTYICNRSGKYRSRTNKDRRFIKRQSCKMDKACISEIRLTKGDHIHVQWITTHYGHGVELQHLRISKLDRALVASKLLKGTSKTRILNDVKDHVNDEIKRVDLLTGQDIDNIRRSLRIEQTDCPLAVLPRNMDRIYQWIRECMNLDDYNPIRFYKGFGEHLNGFEQEDFCLILMSELQKELLIKFHMKFVCIDTIHGSKDHSYSLITLYILNEQNKSFPVVFMFTNRWDDQIQIIFLQTIQKTIANCKLKVFMANFQNAFHSLWLQVIGTIDSQLFSPWDVDKVWQMYLPLIKVKEKRNDIYRQMKLLVDILDPDEFLSQIINLNEFMLNDKETEEFGEYFQENFLTNYKSWAPCFYPEFINGIDSLTESCKIIEEHYTNGVNALRLDKSIKDVMTYARELITELNHVSITSCSDAHAHTIELLAPNKWSVKTRHNVFYVKKHLNTLACCEQVCETCHACVHTFTCSCAIFLFQWRMCEHIHVVSKHVWQLNANHLEVFNQSKLHQELCNNISELYNGVLKADCGAISMTGIERIQYHLNCINRVLEGEEEEEEERVELEDCEIVHEEDDENVYIIDSIEGFNNCDLYMNSQ